MAVPKLIHPWYTSYFPGGSDGKESGYDAGGLGLILGQEDPLEKGMATHSSNRA